MALGTSNRAKTAIVSELITTGAQLARTFFFAAFSV
jgi:hypothetical protein